MRMNFFALAGSQYENAARGILYVIYEVLWKLMYYVLTLIDEITKLFYKVAGINVKDGVVENQNMFDQLLNNNLLGGWYWIFMATAAGLIIVFTMIAIIKYVTSNEEKRSIAPILKNVGLASLLLIAIGPIVLFVVSIVSNFAIIIAKLGGDTNISIADIIFSNSGNLITAYNEKFLTTFTSFRELGNDFLYELIYNPATGENVTPLSFHWYIVILGGGFVLYNLVRMVIDIAKRIFNIVILYLGSPFAISKMALDDGKSFRDWQNKFIKEFLLFLTQIGTFMVFIALVNILNNIDFEGLVDTNNTGNEGDLIGGSLLEPDSDEVPEVVTNAYSLLNGLGRTLIMMAAISVTRSSSTMLTELLTGKESKTDNLLESLISKVSRGGTKTRTITRNTTTTTRETVFVEPSSKSQFNSSRDENNKGRSSSVNNRNTVNQNITVNNKFNSVNNNSIANRVAKDGIKTGSYADGKVSPSNIYINATKSGEPAKNTQSFRFMDSATGKSATNVIKEYTKANINLTNAINSGDNTKLKSTMREYTKAYNKEAAVLSQNYKQFESHASATMKSEVSAQTRQELRNITDSYRKAQMDYDKTANKLKEVDGERMSTADALRLKEKADKQRETLINASNKAAEFYDKQKRGE